MSRTPTAVLAVARALPGRALGAPRSAALVERNLLVWRRAWIVLAAGGLEPLLYLLAIGLGVGELVGTVPGPAGAPVDYATYIAPGMLAAAAMNGAVFEMYNVFFKLTYMNLYDAALATPVAPRDIVVGEVVWAVLRAGLYAVSFLAVTAVLGLLPAATAVLALPVTLLIGFAFGAATIAATTLMRSYQDFDLLMVAVIPMFLFSATFYPLEVYPEGVRWITRLSPLYHGVELTRAATLGVADWTLPLHAAVLAALGAAGTAVATRRVGRLLLR